MTPVAEISRYSHHMLPYRNLGDVYGLPKMHYKGKQGDFYIMVCLFARSGFSYYNLA